MIDLRCPSCLLPAQHNSVTRCDAHHSFVLMDSERARELLIERARATSPDTSSGKPAKETERSAAPC